MPKLNPKDLQRYIERVRQGQGNIVWPDFVQSGRNVDDALLKRSPNKPLVQRLGGLLFGIPLVLLAVLAMDSANWSPIAVVVVSPGLLLGLAIVWAAIR
jgi:hypothetical protein